MEVNRSFSVTKSGSQKNKLTELSTCNNLITSQVILFLFCFADINECTVGSNECHDNATCTNTDGSYLCSCNKTFSGDGRNCSSKNVMLFSVPFFNQDPSRI